MRVLFVLLVFSYCHHIQAQYVETVMADTSLTFDEIVDRIEKHYQLKTKGKHSGYKQYERWKYFAQKRLDKFGKVITKAQMAESLTSFKNEENRLKSIPQNHNWQPLGPVSTSRTSSWSSHIGRITSVSISATDPLKIIVGAASGGVWRTFDGGLNWTPIFDKIAFLEISSVAISPHNNDHYIVGTEDGGTYQSIDAGQTWSRTNIWIGTTVLSILFDPINPDIIIAGGNYLSSQNYRGRIFRSDNGGTSWTYIKGYNHALYDLEFMPGYSDVVYAGVGTSVEVSKDNGITFTNKLSRLPGVTMLGVTPADPSIVYRMRADERGGLDDIYMSTDTGRIFERVFFGHEMNLLGADVNQSGGQAPRDMDIAISPTNADDIVVGGIDTYRSIDGGDTWTKLTAWQHDDPEPFIHADVDIMTYAGNRLYFGTDGGLFFTDDMVTFHDRSQGLNIRQFYKLGVSSATNGLMVAGSQDNGGSFRAADGSWTDYIGADGMEGYVSKFNSNKFVQSVQRGQLYYSLDGGLSVTPITGSSDRFGLWVVPLHEGTETGDIYHGRASYIYRSSNLGDNWTQLDRPRSGVIYDFDISENDEDNIIGIWSDSIYATYDGGHNWINVTPPGEFEIFSSISLHPTNHNRILTTTSGPPAAFYSNDGGASWTDITSNLPSGGINQMIFEANLDDGIFAATSVGIFYLGQGESIWVSELRNMPSVDIQELEIVHDSIYAATYGRGIWRAPIDNVGEIYGCTDSKAHNYNPAATYDNGTCETCDDYFLNGNERGVDCGTACNRPCSWLVQHGFDFYDASLRWADSSAIAGDTVLFAYWLDHDTVKVSSPMIEMEDHSYWKGWTGFNNISISNLDTEQTTALFKVKQGLTIENLNLTGRNSGGSLLLELANEASAEMTGGGFGSNAEIKKK